MNSTNPITVDGITYDKLSLSLSINGTYRPDGTPDASCAATFFPTSVQGGEVKRLDANPIPFLIGSIAESGDSDAVACMQAIETALQTFIHAKGL
jgi:hypothetical protein